MDLSWSELLVIGIVALIIIGPKDLPGMFRELGRFTAKIRSMGREFSRAMEQAAKESGVKDVANDLNAVVDPLRKAANPSSMGLDAVKSAADKFERWDPLKNAAKPTVAPTVGASVAAAAPVSAEAPPVVSAAAPATALGPETAALAERQAARKAVAAEAAAKLRAVSTGVAAEVSVEAPAKAGKVPGRSRKKADKPAGDAA